MLTGLTHFAQTTSSSGAGEAAGAALGIITLLMIFALFALGIAFFVMWIITLIHVIQHEDVPDRTLWIILHFIIGSIIGPIYWFVVKKPYDKKHR